MTDTLAELDSISIITVTYDREHSTFRLDIGDMDEFSAYGVLKACMNRIEELLPEPDVPKGPDDEEDDEDPDDSP